MTLPSGYLLKSSVQLFKIMSGLLSVLLNQNILGRGDGGWRFTKYSKGSCISLTMLNTIDLVGLSIVILFESRGKRKVGDHMPVSWGLSNLLVFLSFTFC